MEMQGNAVRIRFTVVGDKCETIVAYKVENRRVNERYYCVSRDASKNLRGNCAMVRKLNDSESNQIPIKIIRAQLCRSRSVRHAGELAYCVHDRRMVDRTDSNSHAGIARKRYA